jgi:hypothetical protein
MKSPREKNKTIVSIFSAFCRLSVTVYFISAVSVSGCLHFNTRVTGIEPQAKSLENQKYTVLGESEGQSSSFNLLWFIPVTPRMNYAAAVDQAVSSKKGDNLIDVRTWKERQVWIVGTVEILYVRGKVIRYDR